MVMLVIYIGVVDFRKMMVIDFGLVAILVEICVSIQIHLFVLARHQAQPCLS